MLIGIPTETTPGETPVAITPETARQRKAPTAATEPSRPVIF